MACSNAHKVYVHVCSVNCSLNFDILFRWNTIFGIHLVSRMPRTTMQVTGCWVLTCFVGSRYVILLIASILMRIMSSLRHMMMSSMWLMQSRITRLQLINTGTRFSATRINVMNCFIAQIWGRERIGLSPPLARSCLYITGIILFLGSMFLHRLQAVSLFLRNRRTRTVISEAAMRERWNRDRQTAKRETAMVSY